MFSKHNINKTNISINAKLSNGMFPIELERIFKKLDVLNIQRTLRTFS